MSEMGIKRSLTGRKCSCFDFARVPFAFVTITILSLLVPLSFLMIARISCESYLLSLSLTSSDQAHTLTGSFYGDGSNSFMVSFIRYTNPFLIQLLVSTITLATLFRGMTGKNIIQDDPNGPWFGPHLYAAWIFLCTLQVCVGLGTECSIEAGSYNYMIALVHETGLPSRIIFFLGLHETMVHWSRSIVKPIVDDTVFGGFGDERVMQKVALAAACGWLWWWRLKDEVENLVIVAEIKQDLGMDVGLADFVSWWLYYIVVTIGLVRLVRSFIWVSMALCCRSFTRISGSNSNCVETDEKVLTVQAHKLSILV